MYRNIVMTMSFALTLMGCSHGMMRGSVAMKISDTEAHVCMGENEVKPGDKLTLFESKCGVSETRFRGCQKVQVGEGEIVSNINEHYSVMKVSPGTPLREGIVIEKK